MTGALARNALLAVLGAACASAPKPLVVTDGTSCSSACVRTDRVRIDPAFSEKERGIIEHSLALWTKGSGGRACFTVNADTEDAADLIVVRLKYRHDLRPFSPTWRTHSGLYRNHTVWVVMEDLGSERALLEVLAHEVGHAIGLPHHPSPASIMSADSGRLTDDGELGPLDRKAYCSAASGGCSCP